MERIIYRKTLDLHKSGVQFTLQGFQTADNMSRTLELSLMASGDTIELPLEQLMAVMYVTTPNATEPSIIDCKIKDNTVVCDVLPIVEEGITEIQIKLIETGVEGASGVLATPKFAIEVSKSNMDEEGATQNLTFSALETALAQAKGVYDSRVTRIVLSPDCIFSVHYADGTTYTSDALKDVVVNGESLIAKSYARGGTGVRDGEDTDNSMYYSNVSKSSSIEANSAMEDSLELLEEVRKHGVYTAFSFNFEKGELEYVSPMYKFEIDKETGELVAIGEAYTPEETINLVITEWLDKKTAEIDEKMSHDYPIEVGECVISENKETGEKMAWTYRKWNSGIAECWMSFLAKVFSINVQNDNYAFIVLNIPGNDYNTGISFPSELFEDIPFVNYDISNGPGVNFSFPRAMLKRVKSNQTSTHTGCLYVDVARLYPPTEWGDGTEKEGGVKLYTFPNDGYIPVQISIEAKGRCKKAVN